MKIAKPNIIISCICCIYDLGLWSISWSTTRVYI